MFACMLDTLSSTRSFGKLMGKLIRMTSAVRCIFLTGEMGAGKTELTRSIVEGLPGGDKALVASPSFSICNHYPTAPEILHCDLYRCHSDMPDELLDTIEDKSKLVIIEWANFMPAAAIPTEVLDIRLKECDNQRLLTISPKGAQAEMLLQNILTEWTKPSRR